MKINWMQLFRFVMMVLAIAGIIYALEFMNGGIAVWFWVAVLAIGFTGLLYMFRLTQHRQRQERKFREQQEKRWARRNKRPKA